MKMFKQRLLTKPKKKKLQLLSYLVSYTSPQIIEQFFCNLLTFLAHTLIPPKQSI